MKPAVILSLLCLATGAAANAETPSGRVDRIVRAYMTRESVPGVAVVVLKRDRVVMARGWGFADRASGAPMSPRALQPIYSISKHITAALVVQLDQEGALSLGEPAGRRLPEWFADEPELRIEHLLRQTSGLPEFLELEAGQALDRLGPDGASPADVLAVADAAERRFAPGARWAYSNTNYTALALLAERAGGEPLAEAVERRLFRPLGLDRIGDCESLARTRSGWSTGYTRDGAAWPRPYFGATYVGNGGLCADAITLARWMRALSVGRVLAPDRFARMTDVRPVAAGYAPPYGFGLSRLELAGRRTWMHTGGGEGWGALAAYLPDQGLTIVVLANRGWLLSTDLAAPIARAFLGAPEPARPRPLPITPGEQAELSGRFEDGLFNDYRIGADAARVTVSVPQLGAPIELVKTAPGRFVAPDRPDTFVLLLQPRTDGGRRLVFHWTEHPAYLERK